MTYMEWSHVFPYIHKLKYVSSWCAHRARLCVWIALTNIRFIDESMEVQILFS